MAMLYKLQHEQCWQNVVVTQMRIVHHHLQAYLTGLEGEGQEHG